MAQRAISTSTLRQAMLASVRTARPTQPTTGPLESGITNRLYEVNNAIAPYYASSFAITGINDSAFGTITSTDSQGRWAISRTASNLITLTKNGASIGTVRLASGSPSSVNFLHSQRMTVQATRVIS